MNIIVITEHNDLDEERTVIGVASNEDEARKLINRHYGDNIVVIRENRNDSFFIPI